MIKRIIIFIKVFMRFKINYISKNSYSNGSDTWINAYHEENLQYHHVYFICIITDLKDGNEYLVYYYPAFGITIHKMQNPE